MAVRAPVDLGPPAQAHLAGGILEQPTLVVAETVAVPGAGCHHHLVRALREVVLFGQRPSDPATQRPGSQLRVRGAAPVGLSGRARKADQRHAEQDPQGDLCPRRGLQSLTVTGYRRSISSVWGRSVIPPPGLSPMTMIELIMWASKMSAPSPARATVATSR
jgi:hypothetical protein